MSQPKGTRMQKLKGKQQLFVDEYLLDPNATQAAINAGYSEKNARHTASRLLTKANILKSIIEGKTSRSERTKIDADWLLSRLADEAEADMADLYHPVTGALKPMAEWPLIWRTGLVSGVEVQQEFEYIDGDKIPSGVVTKVKLSDRIKRLELVGKHVDVKAFGERVELDVTDKLGDLLKEISPRTLDPND